MTLDDASIFDLMHNVAGAFDQIINTIKGSKTISNNKKRIWCLPNKHKQKTGLHFLEKSL